MMKRSILNLLPILLLGFSPVMGNVEMVRSQAVRKSPDKASEIEKLVKIIKTGDKDERQSARQKLSGISRTNPALVESDRTQQKR